MHIDVDVSKCVACAGCTVACMDQNDIDIKNGELPLRYMYQYEEQQEGGKWHITYLSAGCMHCDVCKCAEGCPGKCFIRDAETGMMIYHPEQCIKCGICLGKCPFHAVVRFSDKSIHKCNGCIERLKAGLVPACVHACPTGALRLVNDEDDQMIRVSLRSHPEMMEKAQRWK